MRGKFQLAAIVALALLAGLAAEPAFAQRGMGQAKKAQREARREQKQAQQAAKQAEKQAEKQQPNTAQPAAPPGQQGTGAQPAPGNAFVPGRGPGPGVPPQWLDRLHQMTPQDQERFMNNNQRFRNLPAERQAEIRERLRRWNSLTPQQQDEMRRRQQILAAMTPEERRRIREEILPRWQQLPPFRRQPIMRRLRALNGLTDEERDARLKDDAFLRGLNEEDRELLRQLARLRGGGPPEPPQENPPLN